MKWIKKLLEPLFTVVRDDGVAKDYDESYTNEDVIGFTEQQPARLIVHDRTMGSTEMRLGFDDRGNPCGFTDRSVGK